jgi:hypothetical protein
MTDLADVETLTYLGYSDDGKERWLRSSLTLLAKGVNLSTPIDFNKDKPHVIERKRAEQKDDYERKKPQIEENLKSLDAKYTVCGFTFEKGKPKTVDFRSIAPREREKSKAKIKAAIENGLLQVTPKKEPIKRKKEEAPEGTDVT